MYIKSNTLEYITFMSSTRLPIIGIICDQEIIGPHAFHIAGDKYVQAIVDGSNCLPILIPALAEKLNIEQLLDTVDGILFTGGYSMVNPLHYQTEPAHRDTKLDDKRDNSSLPLIRNAVAQQVPILGICRGFQEMNVAFGGTLHQYLHETGGFLEHRENKDVALSEQYGHSHTITLTQNGQLSELFGTTKIEVNSLHTQGIDRLGKQLVIEAQAEDGLVEAFSVADAPAFAMAVQWHPEWQFNNNPFSKKLFAEFGNACKQKQQNRGSNG